MMVGFYTGHFSLAGKMCSRAGKSVKAQCADGCCQGKRILKSGVLSQKEDEKDDEDKGDEDDN